MPNDNNEEETKPPASCKFFHQVMRSILKCRIVLIMRMVLRRHWGWGVKLPSRPKSRSWEVPRVPLRISPRDSTPLFPRCPRTPNCKSMLNVQSASSSSSRQTYWRSTWSCTMERRRNSVPSVRNPSTPTITLKLTWGLTLTWSPSAVPWRFVQIIANQISNWV